MNIKCVWLLSPVSFVLSILLVCDIALGDLEPFPTFNIVATNSSKCLDIPGGSNAENLPVQQWDCLGNNQQIFTLGSGQGHTTYTIRTDVNGTKYLKPTSASAGSTVVQVSAANSGIEYLSWYLEFYVDNKFRFKYTTNGTITNLCLKSDGSANGSTFSLATCGGTTQYNQQFYLEPAGGHYSIKPLHSGKCLDIEGNSSSNNARVEQDTCNFPVTWSQQWKVIKVNSFNPFYALIPRNSGKLMDLTQSNTTNGTAVQQYTAVGGQGATNQHWRIVDTNLPPVNGQRIYQIQSRLLYTKCLDIEGSSQSAGANAQIWDCLGTGQNNQLFFISK